MKKRFMGIALSLAAASALATAPAAAFAVEGGTGSVEEQRVSEAVAADGTLSTPADALPGSAIEGDGWMLDADGVLTIEKDIPKPSDFRYEWQPYAERIREVRLAEGVTAISNGAFASNSYGVNPIVYSNLTKFTACSTLKTIGWSVFSGTRSLTEVHLNDGLEAIQHSAFADTGITSIDLPDGVTLGGDCFTDCSELTGTLIIPGGTKFEDNHNATFYGIGVDTVVIEEGVEWIPNAAFNECVNLKRIFLPDSMRQIGGNAPGDMGGDMSFTSPIDQGTVIAKKGSVAEQYVLYWKGIEGEGWPDKLVFHAIDGEEHEFGPWETVSEATCTEAGARKHSCSVCGAERTESLPALGHAWGEGVVTAEPTASAEGERTFTCGRCGVTRTEPIARLEQEASTANGGKAEGTDGGLPATGDPVSTLGLLAASGAAVAVVGEALRRRK